MNVASGLGSSLFQRVSSVRVLLGAGFIAAAMVTACRSDSDSDGCGDDSDCKGERVCRDGECVDTSEGGGGSPAASGGSTGASGQQILCDTSREGWCSCYQGSGAESWWVPGDAVDSCVGYSCCYTYTRASDTKGCSCTNDYSSASCASSVSSANGVVVDGCPAGFSGGAGGTSGGDSCGEPCPSGCCSPSGYSCCQPPFCGGDCIGSPCC